MTWSKVTATPMKLKTRTGCGARPGADEMAWLPKIRVVRAGMATRSPSVATTLTRGDDSRRCRKSKKYRRTPSAGPATTIDTRAEYGMPHPSCVCR